jgi:hypothetical protein
MQSLFSYGRSQQDFHFASTFLSYWEIIADNLSKAGWSWGCVSAVDSRGREIFFADAHRGDGKRFVVHADEKLTAFVELESAIGARGPWALRLSSKNSGIHLGGLIVVSGLSRVDL